MCDREVFSLVVGTREDGWHERLTRAMVMLDDGHNRIVLNYGNDVIFRYEGPETFGARHFVVDPIEGSNSRFAIEE